MILHGDVIEKLKEIETGTVQCVVTSPPYWGLRDYGTAEWEGGDDGCDHIERKPSSTYKTTDDKRDDIASKLLGGQYKDICKKCGAIRKDEQLGLEETPEEYVEKMVEVFRQIKRVLKHDGTVWLNLGDSYAGGNRCAGMAKEDFSEKQKSNRGSLVEPSPIPAGLKPKDLVGIPWRVAFALQADGWYLRQDIIWHKPNPMPESVTDRCTKAHEYLFLLSKNKKYHYNHEAIKEPAVWVEKKPRPSGMERNAEKYRDKVQGKYSDEKKYGGGGSSFVGHSGNYKANGELINPDGKRNKRSVWTVNTKPYKEAHFAVFPPELPELCIKAGTSEGDTVLDPFFGSGTTGWVAQRLGRKWIGIELNEEYIKIAERRLSQKELFA